MSKNIQIYTVLSILLVGLTFLGIGCIDNENGSDEQITTEERSILIKGSDTVLPLSQAEAEEFMINDPDTSVTVVGGGSGVGIAALIDGEVDIAMASRNMKDSEIENAQNNGIDPVLHIIAWDGIAVVVNPENPISELTFDQVRSIYNGDIKNWKEVGGEDRIITTITRDSSSGTYGYFQDNVLQGDEYRADALVQPATGAIVQEISHNKGAIGYIGFAYLYDSVKGLALNEGEGAVYPETETIISGTYPLSRPLYYYTDGEPTGLAKEYLDFVMSQEGQDIISDVGYFPVV
ncbi:MAG: PstS family phosphate ABC transporter substrate-binding protein [Methanosarcinaceae archaeon]|nr:PstS family phosphate ABC transporter substrate-binding protein [Methanosarcinaceae archaeon]